MELELKAEHARLNAYVAVTVAIVSVAMAIGNIKNSNIEQQMTFTKGNSVDVWNEYQATRIKLHTDENTLGFVNLSNWSEVARTTEVKRLQDKIAKYTAESKELKAKAEGEDRHYDERVMRHDQFDMAEAFDSVAISLAAVAALTDIFWLLCVSWGFAVFGIAVSVATFAGADVRIEFLAHLLG